MDSMSISLVGLDLFPEQFPCMPIEAVSYFSSANLQATPIEQRPLTVLGLCEHYRKKYNLHSAPAPKHVTALCEALVAEGLLSRMQSNGPDGMQNSYLNLFQASTLLSNSELSFRIYGFPFIYEHFKKHVVAIQQRDAKGDPSIGTGFFYAGGILTAQHCIKGAKELSIQGVSSDTLQSATFWVPENENLDIAFIKGIKSTCSDSIRSDAASVLDEVMTLGFPKVPGYHHFLAAEKATVSARFTATKGAVAASAEDIFVKERLLLITARIQGGNSGGPVINRKGYVVGISVNTPESGYGGGYDDLGYGTAIPMAIVHRELIDGVAKSLDVAGILFKDFP